MMKPNRSKSGSSATTSRGFTLIELLVVMLIIMLVSAATLPAILSGLQQRQMSEAGRIFQAALAGARDSAIANNAPRGIRLLPDPVLTSPAVGNANGAIPGTTTWACNRFIPIEPAADYSAGRVTFFNPAWNSNNTPAWYLDSAYSSYVNFYGANGVSGVLMVMQSFTDASLTAVDLTSWAWNLRVGDKIQFEPSGSSGQDVGVGSVYTIVGPIAQPNPEGFINYGASGPPTPTGYTSGFPPPEFLLLVNGVDDDSDGFVDNGFNGVTTPLNLYESEKWLGPQVAQAANPSTSILHYVAKRRPVPARGARETLLPANVVIDLTTWNRSDPFFPERSRLPVDPNSRYIDVLLDPSGQVIQTSQYSSPASAISPFLHFWLTDREGVTEPLWGMTKDSKGNPLLPIVNPNAGAVSPAIPQHYMLSMPAGTSNYTAANGQYLQGERMLVTIFTRTGNVTINSLQNFDGTDINAPFYAAQRGAKESP